MLALAVLDPEGFAKALVVVVPLLVLGFGFFYAPIKLVIPVLITSFSLVLLTDPTLGMSTIPLTSVAIMVGKAAEVISFLILTVVTFMNFFSGNKPKSSGFCLVATVFKNDDGKSLKN